MDNEISIDPGAGPCFGVQRAIQMAETLLEEHKKITCLGDLIHNNEELKRLEEKGLRTVSHCQLVEQSGKKLLIRAHGESPSTYRIAAKYEVELIDATCPIVKKLQNQVAEACAQMAEVNGQVILFGDANHAEVIALKGYCKGELHVVNNTDDLQKVNPAKATKFFSQTTKYQSDYRKIVEAFKQKKEIEKATRYPLEVIESVCKYVAKRDIQLIDFLRDKDVMVFVSGRKSSNGKYLFNVGREQVTDAYFISNPNEPQKTWFKPGQKIGISGATSTPFWLLEETQIRLEEILA